MANLFEPPPKYALPLTTGGDLSVEFRNNPSGDGDTFENYEPATTLTLYIDTDPQTVAEADIDGFSATVKIESSITDDIPSDTKWRLILSLATDPSTEVVVAYGVTKRYG